jgi:aspartate carbamoyltransferase catalytic subunit
MNRKNLYSLEDWDTSQVESVLALAAKFIESADSSSTLRGKVMTAVFEEPSSRTYLSASTSFQRLGGAMCPVDVSMTRFGSNWNESTRDFCQLLSSVSDLVVGRFAQPDTALEVDNFLTVPFINCGNGYGLDARHPVQALSDALTIRHIFKSRSISVLAIGDAGLRTIQSQIRLLPRLGHRLVIICRGPNDSQLRQSFASWPQVEFSESLSEVDIKQFEIVYHHGMGPKRHDLAPDELVLTRRLLDERNFDGRVMHCLPRANELCHSLDDTSRNLYYLQMQMTPCVFKALYLSMLAS